MAALPPPISSTSPVTGKPWVAQGTIRRATRVHGALRQKEDSRADIFGMVSASPGTCGVSAEPSFPTDGSEPFEREPAHPPSPVALPGR